MRALVFVLPVLALVACDNGDTDGGGGGDVDGAQVYADNCAVCHGADGTGSGSFPALTDKAPGLTVADIEAVVRDGVGSMSGFTTDQIDDDEKAAVAQHVFDTYGDGAN